MVTIINVQSHGGFGVTVTDEIMVAPPEMGSEMVESLIDNLEWRYSKDQNSDRAVAYLKEAGFKTANVLGLTVGDGI